MDPLRKYEEYDYQEEVAVTYSYGESCGADASPSLDTPTRAYPQDDLNREVLAQLQADANEFLDQEEWTLIDGYDG